MQTDLTFDWVNSTKLKDWINILSSFPTKRLNQTILRILLIGLKLELKFI